MTNSFGSTNWEEQTFAEAGDGVKIAHAKMTFKYGGHLTGESNSNCLLTYLPDGTGTYVGSELFTGTIDGKQGTVVMQQEGRFDAEHISGTWTITPGSGTGDLKDTTGHGSYDMKMGVPTVDYEFKS
ncbi:DUF3224 domain-containing protein [Actinocrispum sp. NPDC049592]|uniref:DUF3224 domain-containing protein n=1 Tax=Actinocrispum sp. NPDC049592 TaxID=3154835 RepID=UPI0034376960